MDHLPQSLAPEAGYAAARSQVRRFIPANMTLWWVYTNRLEHDHFKGLLVIVIDQYE